MFSFSLLQNYGTANQSPISSDPSGALVTGTIDTASQPTVTTYAESNQPNSPSPDVAAVPAPRALVLVSLGLATLAIARGWQRLRGRAVLGERPA
ncbi:MAG TPA: hypothetical protein VN688_19005 [Gemmataceae bacterium]|nr:hypothetical protein [Gemmataceae bacterium]